MPLSPRAGRPVLALAALSLCSLALAGCSDDNNGSSSSAPASSPATGSSPSGKNTITIKNFTFMPSKPKVKAGAKITVTNKDSTAHTVTGTGSAKFDTGHIDPGKTKTFNAPKKAGSYPFDCSIHPFMKGTLTVN
jgi:plastocyanin